MQSVRAHNLHRTKPASDWIEGIPCGNGTLGVMTYGGPHELVLCLDRSDLWCKTPGRRRRMTAGTLVLQNPTANRFEEGLDLLDALAFRETDECRLEWFVHAERPVLCMRIQHPREIIQFAMRPPNLWSSAAADAAEYSRRAGATTKETGDPYAGRTRTDYAVSGSAATMTLAIDGNEHVQTRVHAYGNGAPLNIAMEPDGFMIAANGVSEVILLIEVMPLYRPAFADPLPQPDWPTLLEEHRRWWHDFWSRSGLHLSNSVIDKLWHLGNYHLGSNCRADTSPIVLQGVWGVDGMPPWNGAYTWDLNVQAAYWPIYTGNHLELGFSLYDWYLKKLPIWCEYARKAPGGDGAALVLQTDDEGISAHNGLASPADGAWLCHSFWQHYQYSHDTEFLSSHCLPVFREHLKFIRHRWRKGADGRYHIEHASSPELTNLATPEHPCRDSAYEIACAKFLASAYVQTVERLGLGVDELAEWARDFLANVVAYPTAVTTAINSYWPEDPTVPDFFVEWPGLETQMSHRHFSHLMMLYPFDEIHRFSPPRLLRTAQNSLHMQILRGQGGWAGFSYPWASLLSTRAAWPTRMPVHLLETFARQAVVPFNGLTLNEDRLRLGVMNQTGAFGPYHLTNFSLESSLMAMAAVQEMLLHCADEQLVFSGGTPPEMDGEFNGFRTPFGDTVSGLIAGGKLVSACLRSERAGTRHLALDQRTANWRLNNGNKHSVHRSEAVLSVPCEAGAEYSVQRD